MLSTTTAFVAVGAFEALGEDIVDEEELEELEEEIVGAFAEELFVAVVVAAVAVVAVGAGGLKIFLRSFVTPIMNSSNCTFLS